MTGGGSLDSQTLITWLSKAIRACSDCFLIHECRAPVPPEGNFSNPKLVIIGQSPGRQEDIEGRPFVGPSGKWVEDHIIHPLGLTREDVYITNVIKCHPKGNHQNLEPAFEECSQHIFQELKILQPKIVFLLGTWAWRVSPVPEAARRDWLNKLCTYEGARYIHMYHPSHIFRKPKTRQIVEELLAERIIPEVAAVLRRWCPP